MKKHYITTVINYCSNDYRFINKSIEEAKKFSHQIIIPISDHFFDGKKENRQLLNLTFHENPDSEFIEYQYLPNKTYSKYKWFSPDSIESRHIWHSTSRYISHFFLHPETEYILFLDADEICDGEMFLKWLNLLHYKKYSAMRIGAYIYFNSSKLRSSIFQISALLLQRKTLDPFLLLEEKERFATYNYTQGNKNPMILNTEGYPLIHHYSWVRTKNEKLQKVKTWGHFADHDWKSLIHNDPEDENMKTDPYYDLPMEKASKIFFDPLTISPDLNKKTPLKFKNVKYVSYTDILKKELNLQHNTNL